MITNKETVLAHYLQQAELARAENTPAPRQIIHAVPARTGDAMGRRAFKSVDAWAETALHMGAGLDAPLQIPCGSLMAMDFVMSDCTLILGSVFRERVEA